MDDSKDDIRRMLEQLTDMVRLLLPKDPPTPSTPWSDSQIESAATRGSELIFFPCENPELPQIVVEEDSTEVDSGGLVLPEMRSFKGEEEVTLFNPCNTIESQHNRFSASMADRDNRNFGGRRPEAVHDRGGRHSFSGRDDRIGSNRRPKVVQEMELQKVKPNLVEAKIDSGGLVENPVQDDIPLDSNLDQYPARL